MGVDQLRMSDAKTTKASEESMSAGRIRSKKKSDEKPAKQLQNEANSPQRLRDEDGSEQSEGNDFLDLDNDYDDDINDYGDYDDEDDSPQTKKKSQSPSKNSQKTPKIASKEGVSRRRPKSS